MKHILLIISIIFTTIDSGYCQNNNVRIDIQLIGYDGFSPLEYSISDGNYYRNYSMVQPDSLGRIVIQKKINSTKFFKFYFENANEERIDYRCRLVLQPNNNYSVICKSHKTDDYKIPYSPDIYSWKMQKGDQPTFYKMDMGQIYYNLFDNATQGHIYRYEWDLLQPDSLLEILARKTNKQVQMYTDLLKKGEIDHEFFEIAKLNVEYFNAYRLASTIESTWKFPRQFGIKDSVIKNKLINVYQHLFKLYPIKGKKLENLFLAERYIDVYLEYLECFKDGKFSIPKKGSDPRKRIEEIKPVISEEVYKNYKMGNIISKVGTLELQSSKLAKVFLDRYPDMKQSYNGNFLENDLVPRSEAFDSLAARKLSDEVIILDEKQPVTSFQQMKDSIGNYLVLIDFWGTWCGPCRYQFKYNKKLKSFLKKHNIKMVYIAKEYTHDRKYWKEMISAYDLSGYHFLSNKDFQKDFEKFPVQFNTIPTYMIVDSNGNHIEKIGLTPADGKDFYAEIKEKLNL